jgi:hypothetical protein
MAHPNPPFHNVKLSAFLESNVSQWLSMAEFSMMRLEDPRDKYECVMRHLPPHISLEVTDIIARHSAIPAAEADWPAQYVEFKNAVISRNSDSDQAAVKKLLSNTQRGDSKPTVFLRKLRSLTQGREAIGCEAIIRNSFFSNLPQIVRTALMTLPNESLDKLATMADGMIEACSDTPINAIAVGGAVGGAPPPVAPVSQSLGDTQFSFICSIMSALTAEVSALKAQDTPRGRSASRGRGRDRGRSQSRGRREDNDDDELCWYHNRWGNKASTCKPPCIWLAKNGQAAVTVATVNATPAAPVAPAAPAVTLAEMEAFFQRMVHGGANGAGLSQSGNGPTLQ